MRKCVCSITLAIAISALEAVAAPTAPPGAAETGKVQNRLRPAERLPPANWGENVSGPLCGVYAACTSVRLIGLKADPRDFIATRYVGHCGGSSPAEVARVVEEAGGKARILSRLSALDLQMVGCPIIANVRLNPTANRFNHWVVVVPGRAGVTVFDGLQRPYNATVAEFLGIWSGVGICVGRDDDWPLLSIWMGRLFLYLSVLTGTLVVLRNRREVARALQASNVKQVCGLWIAALVLSVAGNAVFGDLLNYRKGVAVATAASQVGKYRTGTLDDAVRASTSSNVLLVDARREPDYRIGTIEGAVNIPVTASLWAISSYTDTLQRSTPIVVFCQSARCGYDETIATQLVSLGFTDVTVCDQGWSEYESAARVAERQ